MTTRATTTPVLDIMTRSPVTVRANVTVGELLALFDRHEFNAFPVLDDRGELCGIVTKLDVLRLLRPDGALRIPGPRDVAQATVADVMRRGVVSVEPRDPLVVAADLMVETRLHSLPVVERRGGGPVLVGIVSRGDLLRGLRFALAEAAAGRGAPASV